MIKDWRNSKFVKVSLPRDDPDFSKCDLTGSTFEDCDLTGIAFDGAIIDDCTFIRCRLPTGMWAMAGLVGVNDFKGCVHATNATGTTVREVRTEWKCNTCDRWGDVGAPCWWCGTR